MLKIKFLIALLIGSLMASVGSKAKELTSTYEGGFAFFTTYKTDIDKITTTDLLNASRGVSIMDTNHMVRVVVIMFDASNIKQQQFLQKVLKSNYTMFYRNVVNRRYHKSIIVVKDEFYMYHYLFKTGYSVGILPYYLYKDDNLLRVVKIVHDE